MRLAQVLRHLERQGVDALCQKLDPHPASLARVSRVHEVGYIEQLGQYAAAGGGWIEQDTFVCPVSYDVALLAAGAVCDATAAVIAGRSKTACCLVRPPGHHALPEQAMGFCLLNNVAIAAKMATAEFDLNRVLIVDWDVHHGNGTQHMFWKDPQVAFLSAHRWPFYPGTGSKEETGSGPGLGTTLNLPFEMGIARRAYLDRFRSGLEHLAMHHQPELILISAGFDAHRDDPVGSLGLETEDFAELTRIVSDVAEGVCGGRIVSVLEGGYNPGILAGCVEAHLQELLVVDPGGLTAI